MRLLELRLVRFNRFWLTGIENFYWTVKDPLQLILGTNGCGKSQLLRHTAPIVASKGEFAPGGMKYAKYEHEGRIIEFTCKIGKKESEIRHSFKVDGEELQAGGHGTGAIQKELARQWLGFDETLHDVLSGKLQFTDMGPQKRNEIITKLSTTDLTYANGLFKRVQTALRDSMGNKRKLSERITVDTNRLMTLEASKEVVEQANAIEAELGTLMQMRHTGGRTDDLAKGPKLQQQFATITEYAKRMIETYNKLESNYGFRSFSALVNAVADKKGRLRLCEEMLKGHTRELMDVEVTLADMHQSQQVSIPDLEGNLTTLHEQKGRLEKPATSWDFVAERTVLRGISDIRDVCLEFGPRSTPELNSTQVSQVNEQLSTLRERIAKNRRIADTISSRREIINQTKDVECPKCNHRHKPGFHIGQIDELATRGAEVDQQLREDEVQLEKLEVQLADYNEYVRRRNAIRQVTTRYPELAQVWQLLNGAPELLNNPVEIQYKLEALLIASRNMEQYNADVDKLNQEILRIEQLLEAARKAEQLGGLSKFNARRSELERQISERQGEITSLTKELKELEKISQVGHEADALLKRIQRAMTSSTHELESYLRAVYNKGLGEQITRLQTQLAGIQCAVRERESLESKLEQLQALFTEAEKEEADWKILADALSPKSGLIASQLTGHIGVIVGQMNQIISQIWEYDLEVVPCGIESDELNFVFPMIIKDDDKLLPDVKLGSTGQRDIVNFAFMIMVMIQRGLTQYPLYLDEVGASFDDAHRRRLMEYISFLIDNHKVSQAFMVNHYSDMYNAVAKYETLVLDPTNIVVPDLDNANVTVAA